MSYWKSRFVPVCRTLALSSLLTLATAPAAMADIFNLSDNNSTLDIDTGSQAGIFDWSVDGVSQLSQRWFWIRVGAGAERSVDTLTQVSASAMNTNSDPGLDRAFVTYQDPTAAYLVDIELHLTGGSPGSGGSLLNETMRITNTGNAPLSVHFFEYADYDLAGTSDDFSVRIDNGHIARQADFGPFASESVFTPIPTRVEANLGLSTRDSLNDGGPTVLNGDAGPLGPGNLTWAFEWEAEIGAGGSLLIGVNNSIIPEPATGALLALGLPILMATRRRA